MARKNIINSMDNNIEVLDKPTLKRVIVNDSNLPSIVELLKENPNGLLQHRDEIISLINKLDSEENKEERAFYLTSWNGLQKYTQERIGRGLNNSCNSCLSLLGTTQPAIISKYIKQITGSYSNDGFIQRIQLAVWPDTSREWENKDVWPNTEYRNLAYSTFENLFNLNPFEIGTKQDSFPNGDVDGIPYIRFENTAYESFIEWLTELEYKLRGDDLADFMSGHLSKYRGLIPRLAMIIHLANGKSGNVGNEALQTALNWSEYLLSHALRIYEAGSLEITESAKAILRRITKGDIQNNFTARDIYKNHWTKLSDYKQVNEALQLLSEKYYLRPIELENNETGGRPTVKYQINPKYHG